MKRKKPTLAIGQRVKRIREKKNLSLNAVGLEADLTGKQHMHKIEVGQNVQMTTLHKVATALDVSMSFLVDLNNEIKPGSFIIKEMEKDTLLKLIGQRITELRKEKNLDEYYLSKLAGKDAGWLIRREKGLVDFTLNTLRLISTALGVSMSFVLDIHNEIKKKT